MMLCYTYPASLNYHVNERAYQAQIMHLMSMKFGVNMVHMP